MLSLIGSLLGFGTSFVPKILDYFQDKQDKAHELKLMVEQSKIQLQLGAQKMQMMAVEGDIREVESLHKEHASITRKASQWVINLSATVRPIITYVFFLEFIGLSLAVNFDYMTMAQYNDIWNPEMQAIFAAVLSFWFGQRLMSKWNK